MDNFKKEASAAPDAGNSMLAQSEDAGCQYCAALKQVNDPEEGDCHYCARNDVATKSDLTDCKYCAASAAPGTDCQYCNRTEVTAAAPACKYCAASEQNSNCQYCAAGPQTQNPTTTNSEDFAGQDLDSPAIPKPVPGEDIQEQVTSMDDTTNNNLALDQNGTAESNVSVSAGPADLNGDGQVSPAESVQVDQSKEAMQAIAQQIEQDPSTGINNGPGPQGAAIAVATDAAAIVPGTDVVDGVSRPESYSQNSPGDMALDEDNTAVSPDLTSVLHEGLDTHADNIQRERVVQMVSEALTGFKACKQIIERAQTQAPQLYSSSIMMLKAMIEMAKMLGLSDGSAPAQNPLEAQPQSEWQNPFPVHPDNGGIPQSQHAPGPASSSTDGDANSGTSWVNPFPVHPENGGAAPTGGIGQGVGKLPTSATTQHVAREPLPPGAINAQGQKKYVDPKTGKESFINMKEGRVLSDQGKPVKPIQG